MTLLFDLDNTLIDRNTAYMAWLVDLFALHRMTVTTAMMDSIAEKDDRGYTERGDFYRWLCSTYPLPYTVLELMEKCGRELHKYIPAIDGGLRDLLTALTDKHDLGIVSNGGSLNQRQKLKKSRLSSFFPEHAVFISAEMGCSKPDPCYFAQVEHRLQKKSNQLMIIGDDSANDIMGGNLAGWQTVWLAKGRETNRQPTYTIEQLEDLSTLL